MYMHRYTHRHRHTHTHIHKKQGLGALHRIRRKNEMRRFRSERDTVEDLYEDIVYDIRNVEETFLQGPISDELQENLDDMFNMIKTHVLEAHQS